MRKFLFTVSLLVSVLAARLNASGAENTATKPPPPAPTLEQRIASLEAYVNNGDPTTALKDKDGKIPEGLVTPTSATAGPGHNGWMMTSAALVLFMTLPGLALFYGGLVRRKNVLSVLAQCFGITGLVALLWYAYGYSFVFAGGDGATAWMGDFKKFALLNGVD